MPYPEAPTRSAVDHDFTAAYTAPSRTAVNHAFQNSYQPTGLNAAPTFGIPSIPLVATGFVNTTNFGTPGSLVTFGATGLNATPNFGIPSTPLVATGLDATPNFGTPIYKVDREVTATGSLFEATFGTPNAVAIQPATGLNAAPNFGTPLGYSVLHATGFVNTTNFGDHYLVFDQVGDATGVVVRVRFGTPYAIYDQVSDATGLNNGATFGTATGQVVNPASGFQSTPTFGTPQVHVSEYATGEAPSTTFGTAYAVYDQFLDASGSTSTNFGTPYAVFLQIADATGFQTGAFGIPSIPIIATGLDLGVTFGTPTGRNIQVASSANAGVTFGTPYAVYDQLGVVTGIAGATFGTPYAVFDQVVDATGLNATPTFGTAEGLLRQRTYGWWPSTRFGQASTPTNLTKEATGAYPTTRFGYPQLRTEINLTPHQIVRGVTLGRVTNFGTPSIQFVAENQTCVVTGGVSDVGFGLPQVDGYAQSCQVSNDTTSTRFGAPELAPYNVALDATGFTDAQSFGTPRAYGPEQTGGATGLDNTVVFGTPALGSAHDATGLSVGATFGTPNGVLICIASSTHRETRWGTPQTELSNAYRVYSIKRRISFGRARGFSTFNYPATGLDASPLFGTPAATERYLARHLAPTARFGKGLLIRNPPC